MYTREFLCRYENGTRGKNVFIDSEMNKNSDEFIKSETHLANLIAIQSFSLTLHYIE